MLFVDLSAGFGTHHDTFLHGENALHVAFDRVKDHLLSDPEGFHSTLLILDDISSLEWMGLASLEVQRFARALRALCLKVFSSSLARQDPI